MESAEVLDIKTVSEQPRRVVADGQEVQNHSLKEMIEAEKFLRGRTVMDEPDSGLGIKLLKLRPSGAA
jgi:hypothetical protein